MPRGVASIDPQDLPLPPADRVSGSPRRRPTTLVAFFPAVSSPYPLLPLHPRYRRAPLRRPDHPSWFTSLFTVSLSHLPAPLAHRLPHRRRRLLSSGDADPTITIAPPSSRLRRGVTSSFDRGRCLELESRRVRRIRRTFADPGAGSLGNPSNGDQSRAAGNEGEAPHRRDFGFLPEDDCVKFLRRPDFKFLRRPVLIEIRYTEQIRVYKYTDIIVIKITPYSLFCWITFHAIVKCSISLA